MSGGGGDVPCLRLPDLSLTTSTKTLVKGMGGGGQHRVRKTFFANLEGA